MPKFFCDYCDVYLTHDSMSVRKDHNSGRNHLRNVIDYYQQIGHEKAQSVIDSITSSYAAEGQAHNNPMLPQNQPGFQAAQQRFGGPGRFQGNAPRGMNGMNGMPPFAGAPGGAAPGGFPIPPPNFNFPGGIPPPMPPGFPANGNLPPPPMGAFNGGAPGARGGFPPIPPPHMFGANGGAPGSAGPTPTSANGMPFPFPPPIPGAPNGAAGLPNFPGFPAGMPIPPPGANGLPPMPMPPQYMQQGGHSQGPPGADRR